MTYIKLRDFFKYYKGEPHQAAAVDLLQSLMPESLLKSDSEWVDCFRAAPQPKPSTVENTWGDVVQCARKAGARYSELVAAQWVIESNWGKAPSGLHNYFGLKGPGTKKQTEEVINGKRVTVEAEFLDFKSLEECVFYLVDRWHRDWKQHKGVNNQPNRDAAARDLVRQGYCTDPEYAEKLIRVMNQQSPIKPKGVTETSALLRKVMYFSQRDSQVAGMANRMCFSSSCAMLAAYLRPNELRGPQADDLYLKRLLLLGGETTSPQSHIDTLRYYGIKATFTTTASWADIERQIDNGIPTPCGFLHKGPCTAPDGGGHWLTVIGYTPEALVVHDPFGEYDCATGQYVSDKGAHQTYNRKQFGPRWVVEGPTSGWAIIAER